MDVVCGWADYEDDDQKICSEDKCQMVYRRRDIFNPISDSVDHGILLLIPRFQEDLHKCSNPERISMELGQSEDNSGLLTLEYLGYNYRLIN